MEQSKSLPRPRIIASGPPRRRIPCAAEVLQRIDPAADRDSIKLALRLVAETNMDDEDTSRVSQFGLSLQQEHSRITTEILRLAKKDCLELSRSILGKMLDILIKLDPNQLWPTEPDGWTGWIKSRVAPKPPAKNTFDLYYPKLLELAADLQQHTPELAHVVKRAEQLQRQFEELQSKVTAYYLAAAYLTRYVQLYPDRGDTERNFRFKGEMLESRVVSLLETKTTIEVGLASNAAFLDGVRLLLADSQDLLNTDLPAFQTAMSVGLTGSAQRNGYQVDDQVDVGQIYKNLFNKMRVERKFRLNGSVSR